MVSIQTVVCFTFCSGAHTVSKIAPPHNVTFALQFVVVTKIETLQNVTFELHFAVQVSDTILDQPPICPVLASLYLWGQENGKILASFCLCDQ